MTAEMKRLLPWSAAFVLVGLSMGWLFLLLPSDEQIIRRCLEDGELAEASQILQRMESAPNLSADKRRFLERQKQRVAVEKARVDGVPLARDDVKALLEHLFESGRTEPPESWQLKGIYLGEAIPSPGEFPGAAVEALLPETRLKLRETLIAAAQAAEQPGVAAAWSERFFESEVADHLLEESVGLWRQAGKPAQAWALLEAHRAEDPEWDALRIRLLLEMNRAGEAVDLILARSSEMPDYLGRFFRVEQASELARLADRAEDLFPLLEDYLTAHPDLAWLRNDLVDWKLAQGDLAGAQKILEQAVGELPAAERERLARIYEWSGQPAKAFDLYKRLAEEGSRSALTRLLDLNIGLMRGAELTELVKSLDFNKLDLEQKKALLVLQANQGLYAEGVETLDSLLERTPDDIGLWLQRGHLFRVRLELDEAIASYSRGLAVRPDDLDLLRARGYAHLLANAFEEARNDFLRAYQVSESHDDLTYLINLNRTLGDWDSYYRLLEEAEQRGALKDPELYADLSRHYNQLGRHAESRETLKTGLRVFPENTVLLEGLVYRLDEMDEREGALSYFDRYPGLFQSRDMRRMFVYLCTSLGESRRVLERVESGDPALWLSDTQTIALIAEAYDASGQIGKAYDLYRRAHRLDPQDADAAFRWASILEARGQVEAAETILNPFLSNPSPESLRNAAWFYADAKLYDRAETFLMRFLEETRASAAEDWRFLGDIRLSMGDFSGAKRAYRRAASQLVAGLETAKGP
ncbi:MAG: tetratricopeptide repeat protein [Opitutales bacterium]